MESNRGLSDVEHSLVRVILRHLPTRFQSRGVTLDVYRELAVGKSIADVVLVIRTGGRRGPLSRALSAAESVLLARLRREGPLPADVAERALGTTPGNLTKDARVKELIAAGVLEVTKSAVRAKASWTKRHVRIIAIEAKLTRWRVALAQA